MATGLTPPPTETAARPWRGQSAMSSRVALAFLLATLVLASSASLVEAQAPEASPGVLLREDFDDLSRWQAVRFSGRKESRYRTVGSGPESWLEAQSDASASGLRWTGSFDVRQHPILRWRWMVGGLYEEGNVSERSGDDYPLRVYVVFASDERRAGFRDSLVRAAAWLVGEDPPPQSALGFVWASHEPARRVVVSPYADRARSVVLQAGGERLGQWVEEQVNLLDEYRAAFGDEPPPRATIAIMNDSDDTGESSRSWLDWLELRRCEAR